MMTTTATRLQQATLDIRRLAGTSTPLDVARFTRDAYARALGMSAGAGGDSILILLLHPDAARLSIEDIDHRMMSGPN